MTENGTTSGLSEKIRRLFQQSGELRECPPETGLLRQDEPIEQIYLLESSLVKLTRTDAQGRDIISGLRFSGMMLGAASAVSDNLAAASATTLSFSRVYVLPTQIFLQQMETEPLFGAEIARAIGQNYHEQTLHLARLGALSARGRVASLILQFSQTGEPNQQGEIRVQLPINQTDAASLLLLSREHYNPVLSHMKRYNSSY